MALLFSFKLLKSQKESAEQRLSGGGVYTARRERGATLLSRASRA
jgi:hypothetical protein